jgi:hypothetical protein
MTNPGKILKQQLHPQSRPENITTSIHHAQFTIYLQTSRMTKPGKILKQKLHPQKHPENTPQASTMLNKNSPPRPDDD